jgi:hypothetical protein
METKWKNIMWIKKCGLFILYCITIVSHAKYASSDIFERPSDQLDREYMNIYIQQQKVMVNQPWYPDISVYPSMAS